MAVASQAINLLRQFLVAGKVPFSPLKPQVIGE
jgi:hypothetical protein